MPARSEDLTDELPEVEQDLYELLNVKKDATEEEIRSAYRRQALKHHPGKFFTIAQHF
jgi:DnaJ family protein C protein 9